MFAFFIIGSTCTQKSDIADDLCSLDLAQFTFSDLKNYFCNKYPISRFALHIKSKSHDNPDVDTHRMCQTTSTTSYNISSNLPRSSLNANQTPCNHLSGIPPAVVNMDSQQIYRSMPIMRATPLRIPTHYKLYSFLDENEPFTAVDWAVKANKLLSESEKPVVFVGGTGFYLKTLLCGIPTAPSVPNNITTYLKSMPIQELQSLVSNTTPNFKFTDRHRLERAAGVYLHTNKPITFFQSQPNHFFKITDFCVIQTNKAPKHLLKKRIERMVNLGALHEAQRHSHPSVAPIGLSSCLEHFSGKLSHQEMIEDWANKTNQYARRQQTFFKKLVNCISDQQNYITYT